MPHDLLRKAPGSVHRMAATLSRKILRGLLTTCLGACPALAADAAAPPLAKPLPPRVRIGIATAVKLEPVLAHRVKHADFRQESASRDARVIADWIVDSGDSQRMPFAIIDKKDAKVFVFDADGQLRGTTPALLGLAVGDDAVPGIGNRALSSIRPEERTTPAGRFVASLDRNLKGKEILWVDYAGAVSLHPVVPGTPLERRQQRLTSPTPLDNRISYGCINVPAIFFNTVVRPAFTGTSGIVYVLPETRSAQILFGSYEVGENAVLARKLSAPGPVLEPR